jgi:hypothetical protein
MRSRDEHPYNAQTPISSSSPRAISKCHIIDCLDGGGYHNTFEGRAPFECPLPNLLEPLFAAEGGRMRGAVLYRPLFSVVRSRPAPSNTPGEEDDGNDLMMLCLARIGTDE